MNKYNILQCFTWSALLLCSCKDKKGTYHGTCTNITAGGAATLSLDISKISGEEISGELILHSEELEGGGTFTGQLIKNSIIFRTYSEGVTIVWLGNFNGDTISGSYSVPATIFTPVQHGTWTVSK